MFEICSLKATFVIEYFLPSKAFTWNLLGLGCLKCLWIKSIFAGLICCLAGDSPFSYRRSFTLPLLLCNLHSCQLGHWTSMTERSFKIYPLFCVMKPMSYMVTHFSICIQTCIMHDICHCVSVDCAPCLKGCTKENPDWIYTSYTIKFDSGNIVYHQIASLLNSHHEVGSAGIYCPFRSITLRYISDKTWTNTKHTTKSVSVYVGYS